MECLFCGRNSDSCLSSEHVLPESLGNTEHVLPRGVVCDSCNNYFSRKVEKPLIESVYIRERVVGLGIPTKRGRAPRIRGVHAESKIPIELAPDLDTRGFSLGPLREKDESRWLRQIQSQAGGTLILPSEDWPDPFLMSRFLAMTSLEALALRVSSVPGGIGEIAKSCALAPLRNYARRGSTPVWEYCARKLYPPDKLFDVTSHEAYQVLHEWTFVFTDSGELLFILALFGDEFSINMEHPKSDAYYRWLEDNGHHSPLYPGGIEEEANDGDNC